MVLSVSSDTAIDESDAISISAFGKRADISAWNSGMRSRSAFEILMALPSDALTTDAITTDSPL